MEQPNILLRSAVRDMLDIVTQKHSPLKPVEMERLDFGQYSDHTAVRPYNNVVEGVNWYLHQDEVQYLPDELILPMVAHNFGISMEEAIRQFHVITENEDGVVDLS